MRYRHAGSLLALLVLPLALLGAQRTNDESRLVVGLNVGYIKGGALWHTDQPIRSDTDTPDVFRLSRQLRSDISVGGHLTYFPRPTMGLTGEISYIGLGTLDDCLIVTPPASDFNRRACATLSDKKRAASAISAMGGVVWRPLPRAKVQPYVKAMAGLALIPRSTTTVTAFFSDGLDDFALPVYAEDGSKAVTPAGALALGFATAANNGYQFSVEFRASAVQVQVVDGPSPVGDLTPPVSSEWQLLPTLTVGFEIVLEKRRGRRY